MINIPDPAIDLVDDPGVQVDEEPFYPDPIDLCPYCFGPAVTVSCCKQAYMEHLFQEKEAMFDAWMDEQMALREHQELREFL